ncbi:MAG: FKBP-type peptidyl-prolyl cis-trans isomerase [Bacteroidales bacterium]
MRVILSIVIVLMFCLSCKTKQNQLVAKPDKAQTQEMLERINRVLVQEDRDQIEGYIKRSKLDGVQESKTGLFYLIWGDANGDSVKKGNLVEYSFRITLLDGTLCYQSKPDSLGTFVVGHGGVETGLEQGILLMRQGQKAKFIMPPFLAHGLIGDAKRIPARSIIVYDVELLKVNP